METQISSNMEAIVNFFAEMIIKHGDEALAIIEAEKEKSDKKTTVLH